MGYPKLGFSKWQEEDKKLNINQHYLLMQQQAGHIISESPVGLVGGGGGQIHQTWRCRASHSSVHWAGTSLKQRWGLLPAGGATGAEPLSVCVAVRGSGPTATSHHHLTCRRRSDQPAGQESLAARSRHKRRTLVFI